MNYVQIDLEQLLAGHVAVVMLEDKGTLVGRLVERRPDGRISVHGNANCNSTEFFQLFSKAVPKDRSGTIRVVIADGGFWPEQFPQLNRQT